MMRYWLLVLSLLAVPAAAAELTLKPVRVADDVYAVIGNLGNQTYENDGLNANLGFVVGKNGVLVINSGPTRRVAEALHRAIRAATGQPVKWVINVNSQNHYWHGNDYFRKQGATVHAHAEAIRLMHEQGLGQLESNRTTLKEKAAGTQLAPADKELQHGQSIDLGGIAAEIHFYGNAHTPGDIAVWLPARQLLFGGDLMFTERMLAVLPIGSTRGWLEAFDKVAALPAQTVVPGHGRPGSLATARADTRDYLAFLRTEAKRVQDTGGSILEAVEKVDQSRFKRLANYSLLAGRNMSRVYLEIEQESF